ncbi:chalcone-flavanone isomerase [mine drainage metagenome]|uniref:Chalcone-flavanone isomerase n=1 Tax=mine drainage metagenome TaxID=410659 RepID=A0A1J5T5Y2_9ZZZZ
MRRILLLVGGLLLSCSVSAIEVAGVQLADKVQAGNASLQLNGAGIRTKWFFKVYVAALYLPQKQTSGAAIIADEHPHRMAMHMLRELASKKLYGAFSEAIEMNRTPAELAAMDAQMKQMKQIFDAVGEVKEGDIVTLDYLPGSGTQISVNGKAFGTIAGAEFNRVLLGIWIGSNPVQDDLKKGLLGG